VLVLGLESLVMFVSGMKNILNVIPFAGVPGDTGF